MQDMIVSQGLGKTYAGGITALTDVTFTIQTGRVVLLLGANGAGKSSLIHLACQVTRPTTGTISLGITEGKDLGWCSQTQMIDWWTTVYENVLLGPSLSGVSNQDAARATRETLELVGLSGQSNRHCDQLSGGQLQRVQVARALATNPALMFLDEPTVGLDVSTSRKLMTELRRRATAGATIVIASHELDVVEEFCDEILLLEEGRLIAHTPRQAFVNAWSSEEVLVVDHEGELTPQQLEHLNGLVTEVTDLAPLRMRVPVGTSHLVLQKLFAITRVEGFQLETPGLKEAFLRYQQDLTDKRGAA